MSTQAVKCPNPECGMDVMETGWVTDQVKRQTWIRMSDGAMLIATSLESREEARCLLCEAVLPLKAVEMLRAADKR